MTHVARRLLAPLVAIARAEGVPEQLLALPPEGSPRIRLAALLETARRLELALGGPLALLDAATQASVWPEVAVFARQAGCPYDLARVLWQSVLPGDFGGLTGTWEDRGPDHFVVTAALPAPHALFPGLGTLLAAILRATPLFFDLGPAHVEIVDAGPRLSLSVTLPPHESLTSSPASERLGRRDTLDAVVGLLEERALEKVRRVDTMSAARALGEGFATARTSEDAAALALDVLTRNLRFSQVLLWAGPTPRDRRLLASVGERVAPSRIFALGGGSVPVGLLELDEGGDIEFAETLLPWIAAELGRRITQERDRVKESSPAPTDWVLTARQREVAGLLAGGLANKEIALALGCSAATVEDHLTAIYRRVGVQGRGALVAAMLGTRLP